MNTVNSRTDSSLGFEPIFILFEFMSWPRDLWPIFYFGPFDKDLRWVWKGQWRLDGWQSKLISVTLFVWALWLAVERGHSFVGVFNRRVDEIFVGVLRRWRTGLTDRMQQSTKL